MRTARPRFRVPGGDAVCPHCGRECEVIAIRQEWTDERGTECGPWHGASACCEEIIPEAEVE